MFNGDFCCFSFNTHLRGSRPDSLQLLGVLGASSALGVNELAPPGVEAAVEPDGDGISSCMEELKKILEFSYDAILLHTSGRGLVGLLPAVMPIEEELGELSSISSNLRGAIGFVTGQLEGELSVVMLA